MRDLTKFGRKQDLNVIYIFLSEQNTKMAVMASDWLTHFQLHVYIRWTLFNRQKARSQLPLPWLFFLRRPETNISALASDSLRLFRLLLCKHGTKFDKTKQELSTEWSTTQFVFFGPIGKPRWPPWHLTGWYIFDLFSVTVKQNSTQLDRKQYINVLHQVYVFRANRKTNMAAMASAWLLNVALLFCTC